MRKPASVLFFVLCVAVSVAGAYNVFSDNADVKALAEQTACRDSRCGAKGAALTRLDRSPFAQTFAFATSKGEVTVTCRRAAIFVGAYACEP